MIGAAAVSETEPDMRDLVHLHKATGNYHDAITCYEKIKSNPTEHLMHIASLLDIGLPKAAADRAAAYLKENSRLTEILSPLQAHAGKTLI